MIHNATLLRIDTLGEATTGGDRTYIDGPSIAVPCALTQPSFVIQRMLDQLKIEATATVYVAIADMADANRQLTPGVLLSVQPTGGDVQMLRVEHVVPQLSGLSHVMCAVKAM